MKKRFAIISDGTFERLKIDAPKFEVDSKIKPCSECGDAHASPEFSRTCGTCNNPNAFDGKKWAELRGIEAIFKTMNKNKFLIQRPEHPRWFAGWNDHGACWTSSAGDALFVPVFDLVEFLTKLKHEKPVATLYENRRQFAFE